MNWRPQWFAYSYPQADMDHDRKEYGGLDPEEHEISKERVQSWLGGPPPECEVIPFTDVRSLL